MTPEQYQRAKDLFQAAVVLDPEQREAFLRSAGGGTDGPDVVDEVRSLLRHHSTRTLLETGPSLTTTVSDNALTPVSGFSETLPMEPVPRSRRWVDLSRRLVPRLVRTGDRPSGSGSPSSIWWLLGAGLGPRGQLAMGVAVACLLLGLAGYLVNASRELSARQIRGSVLTSALNATVGALQLWIEQEQTRAQLIARHPELRDLTEQLLKLLQAGSSVQQLADSEPQRQLRHQMNETLGPNVRYAIWDRRYVTIADWSPVGDGIGVGVTAYGASLLARVFEGETVLQLPGPHPTITKDYPDRNVRPLIGMLTPVRDDEGEVIAALLLYGMGADERFEDLLSLVQIGETGEVYAFDRAAMMLSASRFEDEFQRLGYLSGDPNSRDGHQLHVRDPGGPLRAGRLPSSPPATWPMTKMARFATAGDDAVDLNGYRNYRGATVIGAWKWIKDYDFGVACEMDLMEARNRVRYPYLDAVILLALLGTALAGVIASYHSIHLLRRELNASRRLGQYSLEEKIGEGGMGVVYKARHVLLKRPTAIKLLKPDVVSARTTHWFEREAQLASQLTDPHTIAIYDYGISEQGTYYYVMEFIAGQTLDQLVRRDGPLSVDRTVTILRQSAESLTEAHQLGLVHRDIKPHNVMVCERGGQSDFVKVLDFGLVKRFDGNEQGGDQNRSTVLAGTPVYMAPERLTNPGHSDPRSDLYAWAAVGYFLLTGREIFVPSNSKGLWDQILHDLPTDLQQLAPHVPERLSRLLMRCLSKSPADRPASMAEAASELQSAADDRYR